MPRDIYEGGADVFADSDDRLKGPRDQFGSDLAQSVNNVNVQGLISPNRPSGDWRPWSDSSVFNTIIPDNAPLYNDGVRTSASIIDYLVTQSTTDLPGTLIFNDGESASDFKHPWYFAKDTDDLVTIRNRYDSSYGSTYGDNYGSFPTQGQQFRVPHDAKPAGTSATTTSATPTVYQIPVEDAHMYVVQPNGNVLTMYRVERGWSNGSDLWCRASGVEPLTGDGIVANQGGIPPGTAAYFAGTPMLRADDLISNKIEHAFFGTTFRTRGLVSPALGQGSETVDTHAPPMGARLRLTMTEATINAQVWPSWVKLIAIALRKYGVFIGDTGGATTGRLVFKMESDNIYRSYPGTWPGNNPLEAWAIANSVPSRVSSSIGPNRTVYELIFTNYGINISDFEVIAP